MHDKITQWILTAVICLPITAAAAGTAWAQSAPAVPGSDFSVLPKTYQTKPLVTADRQQVRIYDFIWRSFIALNWPNVPLNVELTPEGPLITSGLRGKPDPTIPLSALGVKGTQPLTVWETYKEPFEVFPPAECWDQRGEWNSVRPRPPKASKKDEASASARALLAYPTGLTGYATDSMQPYFYPYFTGPLFDQNGGLVRYEVAVNRAFFRYIRNFKYYNAEIQRKAVKAYIQGHIGGEPFQRPPFGNPTEIGPGGYLNSLPEFQQTGFVDLKAAWRVLDPKKPQEMGRYLRRKLVVGFDANGDPIIKHMGLVALHILRWTPNNFNPAKKIAGAFVASTFEQIDNVKGNIDRAGVFISPTFNDGHTPTPEENTYGFSGDMPTLDNKIRANVYRAKAQTIPKAVDEINKKYQNMFPVNTSALQFYKLIGTQNMHQGKVSFATAADRETNGPQGPKTGVISNANNLVNSALESYTQKNFTCILCHIKARPFGVIPSKTQLAGVPDKAFQDDYFKILSFLLQGAKEPELANAPKKQCAN